MAEVMSNPRFQGAMQAFGGLSEASMGAGMTYATGGLAAPLGWPIMAHGLDHFVTGMSTVFTGKLRGSATAELLQKTGMSQNSAELIDSGISVFGTMGAGVSIKIHQPFIPKAPAGLRFYQAIIEDLPKKNNLIVSSAESINSKIYLSKKLSQLESAKDSAIIMNLSN